MTQPDAVAPDLGWNFDMLLICSCGESFGLDISVSSPAAVLAADLTVICPACSGRGVRRIDVIAELHKAQRR